MHSPGIWDQVPHETFIQCAFFYRQRKAESLQLLLPPNSHKPLSRPQSRPKYCIPHRKSFIRFLKSIGSNQNCSFIMPIFYTLGILCSVRR